MSTQTEKIGNSLNDILEKTYDAEKGYKKAAEHTDNPNLKSYFEKKSQERYNFGHEIKSEIKSMGEDIDKGGSASGSLHRAWIDTKAFFSSNDDEAMLEESIRGEKASLEEYNDVLSDTAMPSSTATLLTNQKRTIENGLQTIKKLEDLS